MNTRIKIYNAVHIPNDIKDYIITEISYPLTAINYSDLMHGMSDDVISRYSIYANELESTPIIDSNGELYHEYRNIHVTWEYLGDIFDHSDSNDYLLVVFIDDLCYGMIGLYIEGMDCRIEGLTKTWIGYMLSKLISLPRLNSILLEEVDRICKDKGIVRIYASPNEREAVILEKYYGYTKVDNIDPFKLPRLYNINKGGDFYIKYIPLTDDIITLSYKHYKVGQYVNISDGNIGIVKQYSKYYDQEVLCHIEVNSNIFIFMLIGNKWMWLSGDGNSCQDIVNIYLL
jgi:hypothetical protein